MRLKGQFDAESLAERGAEAVDLLCRGEIDVLARRYGCVFSQGQDPAAAIRADLKRSLDEVAAASLALELERPAPRVTYYKPNAPNLLALVECVAPTENGASLLVELVVTGSGSERHLTLEEISASSGVRERLAADGTNIALGGGPTGSVAIVVDPVFGDRIRGLAADMPAWVIDTPPNRAVAQLFWPGGPDYGARSEITTFVSSDGETREEAFARILPTVDMHHNELAQTPPYSVVEVFGASLTSKVRAALGEFGFDAVQDLGSRLVAQRIRGA